MATGFDIRDVDPEAFISDQRQGEGKGGNRGISLQIIDDVLENSKGLFEENGLDKEIAEKLKQLWINKLDAFNVASDEQDVLSAPQACSSKSFVASSNKKVELSMKSKRRREESKSKYNKQEIVAKLACEPLRTASSSLEASNNLKVIKKPTIGGQVDGPNDTSDEDEDIGNAIILMLRYNLMFYFTDLCILKINSLISTI